MHWPALYLQTSLYMMTVSMEVPHSEQAGFQVQKPSGVFLHTLFTVTLLYILYIYIYIIYVCWTFCMNQFSAHRIWSSHSDDADVSGLSGCDAVPLGELFLTLWRTIVPSSWNANQSWTEDESTAFLWHIANHSPAIVLYSRGLKSSSLNILHKSKS